MKKINEYNIVKIINTIGVWCNDVVIRKLYINRVQTQNENINI